MSNEVWVVLLVALLALAWSATSGYGQDCKSAGGYIRAADHFAVEWECDLPD